MVGPFWPSCHSLRNTRGGPGSRELVDITLDEAMLDRPTLQPAGNAKAVARSPQQRLACHPLACEPLQVGCALAGERSLAMAFQDSGVREQLFEHGGTSRRKHPPSPMELCFAVRGPRCRGARTLPRLAT